MALNKKNRLKKKLDFEDVFRKGRAVKGSFLFIKYKKTTLGIARFGFVVSTKVAKKAVERNKVRRILSETVRSVLNDFRSHDIIVYVTKKIVTAQKKDLIEDFMKVLKKIQ